MPLWRRISTGDDQIFFQGSKGSLKKKGMKQHEQSEK